MTAFIEHLTQSRDRVCQVWMASIQASPAFTTPVKASLQALMNHMPDVYDDMVAYLRGGLETSKATHSADRHASQRWTQHFCISDLVRELLLLRSVVARELDSFQTTSPQPLAERPEKIVRARLSLFFDEALIDSVRQFTSDQQAFTDENDRILADRTKSAESAADGFQQRDVDRLRLLRVITHELRNFLNAASLIAQSLGEETDGDARKYLEATLDRNHQHMSNLLNHLLEAAPILSGRDPLQLAPLNLPGFTRQEAMSLEPMATAKHLRFQYQVAPDLQEVISDEAKLRRVVINLVQNAIKYTDVGSVNLLLSRPDPSHWELRVSDTGPGIPAEHRTKIFEEFHRLPSSAGREGTGLGLAIVKHLVQVMNGEIRVESTVGQGTSFSVVFPIDPAARKTNPGR